MDARRAVIMLGIAVVAYMLVLQWNEDYGQRPTPQVAEPVSNQTPVVTASDIPTVTASDETNIPQLDEDVTAVIQSPVASTKMISVKTDVLDIRIDPVGGDIVYAALLGFPQTKEAQDVPFLLLEQSSLRTFRAQSGLLGANGTDKDGIRAVYTVEKNTFELQDGVDELIVPLTLRKDKVVVTKLFKFKRSDYLINLGYEINNGSELPWQANFYAEFKRDGSGDPSKMEAMGMSSYLGGAVTTPEDSYKKIDFDDIKEKQFKEKIMGGWVAFLQHYFVSAWVPSEDIAHTYSTGYGSGYYYLRYVDNTPIIVTPGTKGETFTSLYLGPKDQDRLSEISENLELTIDYGLLWWVAKPLFWLLQIIHSLVGNWGWAIIFLTIIVKGIFFPLSAASYRSMANMRRVAPKLASLKERYGDDRQKMSQKMMELYKKEKINPLGGCLPILVQMPVFIALYWVLMESVELRQAPFMLWLQDLSVKDPYFILPLIMGASMFIQMQLNPAPQDPMQAKVMKLMPIIFTVFFLFFPAGLVLYWVVNNVLSIAQQWYITRKIEAQAASSGNN